jgi:thiol-disulfide isomerase/thioredoxin
MNKKFFGLVALIVFIVLFGCTNGGANATNDCSKCNVTNDCSKCTADCSKCGGGVGTEPVKIKSGMTMIVPPACTDELCGMNKTAGWAKEIGIDLQVYKADWAQSPIILMYTENSAGLLNPTDRGGFMTSVCSFVNITKACSISKEEFENAKGNMKTCLQKNNVSLSTVAFYHANWCPHCANMKPWVQELEEQGYKFFWVEESDTVNITIAKDCLSGIIGFNDGIPQFACPSNGEKHMGEFVTKDDMLNFVKACIAAAK